MDNPRLILTEKQQYIVREAIQRLSPNINQVIHHWAKTYRELDRTIDKSALYEMEQMHRAYFNVLLGDLNKEFLSDRITTASKRISKMQVPFDCLVVSFHLFEESYLSYMKGIYTDKGRLLEVIVALNYMRYACFSAIASSYFHEKYTGTAPRPTAEKFTAKVDRVYKLTPRESEILKRIVDGYRSREIAEMLRISVKTVEAHRANLMGKLKVRNIANLIKFATRNRMA